MFKFHDTHHKAPSGLGVCILQMDLHGKRPTQAVGAGSWARNSGAPGGLEGAEWALGELRLEKIQLGSSKGPRQRIPVCPGIWEVL